MIKIGNWKEEKGKKELIKRELEGGRAKKKTEKRKCNGEIRFTVNNR